MEDFLYVVTREYDYDLDKSDTTWYHLFISKDYQKAKEYLNSYSSDYRKQKFHICKIPLDVGLDIISWEKYIIKSERKLSEYDESYHHSAIGH